MYFQSNLFHALTNILNSIIIIIFIILYPFWNTLINVICHLMQSNMQVSKEKVVKLKNMFMRLYIYCFFCVNSWSYIQWYFRNRCGAISDLDLLKAFD